VGGDCAGRLDSAQGAVDTEPHGLVLGDTTKGVHDAEDFHLPVLRRQGRRGDEPLQTQAEVDHHWNRLLEGGKPQACGWLTDRFGVSWQIVPTVLQRYLKDPDRAKSARVMQAMMKMIKLDIAALDAAYAGG
jgi:hypothetical protein